MTSELRALVEWLRRAYVCCQLCGEPMPEGEEMFNYHGYSGPCPKPALSAVSPTAAQGEPPAAEGLSAEREADYRYKLQQNIFTWPAYNEAIASLLAELDRLRTRLSAAEAEARAARELFERGEEVQRERAEVWNEAMATLEAQLADLQPTAGKLSAADQAAFDRAHTEIAADDVHSLDELDAAKGGPDGR